MDNNDEWYIMNMSNYVQTRWGTNYYRIYLNDIMCIITEINQCGTILEKWELLLLYKVSGWTYVCIFIIYLSFYGRMHTF